MATCHVLAKPVAAAPDSIPERRPEAAPKLALVQTVPDPLFSPLELMVIGIGKRDRATLVRRGSRLARLQRLLFGIEPPTPFADARLEALRLLTVALRRRESPDAEIAAALAAGVTPQQIEQLRSL